MSRIGNRFTKLLVSLFLVGVLSLGSDLYAACRPSYYGASVDAWTNCTGSPLPGNPVCQFTKSSSWSVTWPDCVYTTFTATCTGQQVLTQNYCCGSNRYRTCFPSFEGPFTGEGYIEEFVRPSIVSWQRPPIATLRAVAMRNGSRPVFSWIRSASIRTAPARAVMAVAAAWPAVQHVIRQAITAILLTRDVRPEVIGVHIAVLVFVVQAPYLSTSKEMVFL